MHESAIKWVASGTKVAHPLFEPCVVTFLDQICRCSVVGCQEPGVVCLTPDVQRSPVAVGCYTHLRNGQVFEVLRQQQQYDAGCYDASLA